MSEFEVYVHVPFCIRRCGYCDFNTYTARDLGSGASREHYASLAIREMELVRQWQLAHEVNEGAVSTVFFGGGTPTILPASDLARMVQAIRDIWGIADGAEITTEANPDTIDDAYVSALADAGFTRISLGMQSAVPYVLRTLDRTHTPANVQAGIRAANRCGLRSSVDLIYGAPTETLDDWRTSVQAAIDLGVDHVSAYALTVEPETKMGRRIAAGTLPRPDDDDEATKYEIADDLLSDAGLQWYEVSNWAREGYESRHNLGYWRNVDWAGIGPGAHSHYNHALVEPDDHDQGFTPTGQHALGYAVQRMGDARTGGLRAWDIAHPRRWAQALQSDRVPWQDCETITAAQDLEERVMLGLRIRDGFDLALTEGIVPPHVWDNFVHDGLVTIEAGHAIATRRGRLLNDAMITEIMSYW